MGRRITLGFIGWFLLTLLSAIWAGACSEDVKGGPGDLCKTDQDCEHDLKCEDQTCIHPDEPCTPACGEFEDCFEDECRLVIDMEDPDGDLSRGSDDCGPYDWAIRPSAHEVCDGVDNDCDGQIDEDCPACRTGDERKCGSNIGECEQGTQICSAGRWQECFGKKGPKAERCDGRDNDCNGLTDENCHCDAGEKVVCGLNEGICKASTMVCSSEGKWPGCIDGKLPIEEEEKCDGKDNDCDGLTDEGFNLGTPCKALGVCGEGVIECAGEWGMRCSTAPGGSQDRSELELCNELELDEDCDGSTDEDCECTGSEERPCGSDVGECIAGTQTCLAGVWSVCQGGNGEISERCNGLDDDCDGETDEDFPELGEWCQTNEGSSPFGCGAGNWECTGDGNGIICDSAPGSPSLPVYLTDNFENHFDDIVEEEGKVVRIGNWKIWDSGGVGAPSDWMALSDVGMGTPLYPDDDGCDLDINTNDCWLVQRSNIWGGQGSLRGTIAYWDDWDAMDWTDYRFRVEVKSRDDDGIGVVFCFKGDSSYYLLLLRRDYTNIYIPHCGYLSGHLCLRALYLIDDRGASLIEENNVLGYEQSVTFVIEIDVHEDSIDIWVDRSPLFLDVSNSIGSGTIGFYSLGNSGSQFDNVLVRKVCPEQNP